MNLRRPAASGHRPIRIGIIGMGGYAGVHHVAVRGLETTGEARLVCTCDPGHATFADQAANWSLASRGVAIHGDYRAMLDAHAGELDVLAVPTPIPLHAEMHREGARRGLAVYLEKPPTLDPAELERMIAQDRSARVPTLVGFNFTGEDARRRLKRRLLEGEFGTPREAHLLGLWPRPDRYYLRNTWAGRLAGKDKRLILDSPVGNALSHHVHNILHWAGLGGIDHWAAPVAVRARLYRAHAIEGADTFLVSAETDSGVRVRIALSHACHGPHIHRETLVCENATIHYVTHDRAEVHWRHGRHERIPLPARDPQIENYRALFACLRGESARPPTTLEDCRAFVHLHALAYIGAGRIETFAPEQAPTVLDPGGSDTFYPVLDLATRCERFLAEGAWPWEEATAPAATPDRLHELDAVARDMVAARAAAAPAPV